MRADGAQRASRVVVALPVGQEEAGAVVVAEAIV